MRVWFNHWFSTAYHLINLIKDGDPEKFYIIGSSTNPLAIYKRACNEWYLEKNNITAAEYIEFCLSFCRKHKVDILVPRRFLVDIVSHSQEFAEIGVQLFADCNDKLIRLLDDKIKTYDFFRKHVPACIPETRIAHSLAEFTSAYEELLPISSRVCYKLAVDEGARSFRVIDNRMESIEALLNKPNTKVTLETANRILQNYNFENPILLMPYLNGIEISADCLTTPEGNLVIPRYKTNKRYSEVILNPEIQSLCSKIMDLMQLKMPLNIQFKVNDGKIYLLEINPRMSGGLQLSCEATGINIPNIAINQLVGIHKSWKYPDIKSVKVAHIETPIILS